METKKIQITLNQNIFTALEKSSKITGKTKSYYIQEALRKYLEDLEDLIMIQNDDVDGWVTNEELTKELGYNILDRGKKVFEEKQKSKITG